MKFFLFTMLAIFSAYSGVSQQIIASLSGITTTQAIDDKVFFAANHEGYGTELYVSNGTPGDFNLVKDIYPGYGSSSPMDFTVFNNQLYFTAYLPDLGKTIWSSDGTKEGTKLIYGVKDADPSNLMVFKGHLYFTTNLGSIVRTDGSSANIQVYYQDEYTWGRVSTIVKNEQYIFFTTGGRTIYRDDGFSRISFFGPLSWEDIYFKKLFVLDNKLVVMKSSTYDTVIRLYAISNEALGGGQEEDEWVVIKKLDAPIYGTQKIENFTNVSGKLFFSFRTYFDNVTPTDELWICDGTAEGTNMVKSFGWSPHFSQSEMRMFFAFNGKLFFRGGDPVNRALWTSDGTEEGTREFHDVILTPPYNDERTPVLTTENKIYFSGGDGYEVQLWNSDGTTEGTQKVFDLEDAEGKPPHDFTYSNEVLYFITSQQFNSTLWSTVPSADISITNSWGNYIKSGSKPSLFYNVSLGACKTSDLVIRNKGLEELYLRSIYITGKDFYLANQSVPETIQPGESIIIQVIYNPVNEGKSRGLLTVLSNDNNESKYTIQLEATPSAFADTEICQFLQNEYVKGLTMEGTNSPILLSNSLIEEGQPQGTIIGEFSSSLASTYTLVNGAGDIDNVDFFIEENQLRSNKIFHFDIKNVYSIRVRSASQGGDFETSFRISVTNTSFGYTEGNCQPVFEQMNFAYTSLEANSAGYLFITTSAGRILRSVDAGQNWEVVYAGNYNRLSSIMFKGNTGYAQGSSFLLKSEDGGATWFKLYLPFRGDYYYSDLGIFFFNDKEGYIGTEEGELFFTDDGGRTWETRLEGSWNEFRKLFFLSKDTGYATLGWGDLYTTLDGGRTWASVDLSALGWNTRVRDLWFTNSQDGFLIGENKFYKTSNGGKTWIEVPNFAGGEVTAIKFFDKDKGFVYGGNGVMYKTLNGGATWDIVYPGIWPARISGVAQSSGKTFITSIDYYYSDISAKALAVSTDEGNTWSTLNNFSNGNIYTIDFSHDNKGVVVGENGIFKTKDNGLTWHQAESDLNTVDDMLFIEENIVVLLSGGHIYKSIDGGETTRIVLTTEQAGSYLPAGKFYLTPGNILFSVSWYATYKSDDLGETWELISTEQGIYIQKMHFISPSIGYRVELFGSVEKTIDGGITWVEIFTRDQEQSKPFNAIYFINETVGYKGGDILQRTTDGGISWEKVDWMFYEIMAIHFENLDHGFVVTRGGIVYETNDAGSTWERIFQTSSRLFDVQFVNNGIFLAGEDGFIARRNTTPTPPSQPGYIYGSNRVCAGDAIEFSIAVNSDYRTQWSTTAGNIEDHTEYITVNFPDPGTYTITAKHFNLCGVSESRSTTITVSAPPETPIIEGPNPSLLGEQGVEYSVINGLEGSEYLWEAEGSASVLPTENGVVIDWTDQVEGGLIKVLEVDTHGCRAYGTLSVTLDVPVGLEGNLNDQVSIYPNPTAWDTQITSSFGGLLFVRIKDSLGREFSTTTLSGMEDQTLLTRKLSSGLYFIEISDGRHVVIKKLIKE